MLLPWQVQELDQGMLRRWCEHYQRVGPGPDRRVEEGLWRRTQDPRNAAWSGWQGPQDARRRLWHYRLVYDVTPAAALAVADVYLYFHVALPEAEAQIQYDAVRSGLTTGGWLCTGGDREREEFARGDLACQVRWAAHHPGDEAAGRRLPAAYRHLDVRVSSSAVPVGLARLPWQILAAGFRTPDHRGNPELVEDLSCLVDLAPFAVEAGCGLSVEAGVPPLHLLHEIYQVSDPLTRRFVLDPSVDRVMARFLADPEEHLPAFCGTFQACLRAEPSPAHRALRDLHRAGALVGPVVTNNFDGLLERCGVPEQYVRRYDEIIPPVRFDPRAKALLVVGSHADRRRVQHRARQRGLRVVFCDPEGFRDEAGKFIPYPLEGPQDEDLLCRRGATQALVPLAQALTGETPSWHTPPP